MFDRRQSAARNAHVSVRDDIALGDRGDIGHGSGRNQGTFKMQNRQNLVIECKDESWLDHRIMCV